MARSQKKDRYFNAAMQNKKLKDEGALGRPAADFSTETLPATSERQEIVQVMETKRVTLEFFHPAGI